MAKAIGWREMHDALRGKMGSIYIARKGSVTVYEVEGTTYLVNNSMAPGGVIINPADDYWCHSIDWAGGFTDYKTVGMLPAETHRFVAEPIVPVNGEHMDNLRRTVAYWQGKAEQAGQGEDK